MKSHLYKLTICIVIMSLSIFFTGCNPTATPTAAPPPATSTLAPTPQPTAEPTLSVSPEVQQDLNEIHRLQNARSNTIIERVHYWDQQGVVHWNNLARQLVSRNQTNPPRASRIYALLSLAQQRALDAVWEKYESTPSKLPSELDNSITNILTDTTKPMQEASVIAGASSAILTAFFPKESGTITQTAKEQIETRVWAGAALRSDLVEGETLGRTMARQLLDSARTDGSELAAEQIELRKGPGQWAPDPWEKKPPVLPKWGNVRPWLMTSSDQFRPAPPPAFGSAEFKNDLAEVRQVSDTRAPEQLRIAQFWADGPGTQTPPGHWNQVAADLILVNKIPERQASHIFAALNMAMMDAGIACWDAKYLYNLIRPWQVDENITTPVGAPNFPSYPSGHSTFSGAAAETLSYFFPSEQTNLEAMAKEASLSRLYGGIHYRFDNETGLAIGKKIGQLAKAFAQKQNW